MLKKLNTDFFIRPVVIVAQELLGKILVFENYRGIITETEAYRGLDDEACHAFRGPTPRTQVMFGPPGVSYVYFIYGMYYCLNIVSEPEGQGSGVLIRGVRLLDKPYIHLDGPGKLCKHFGITKEHKGINLTVNEKFYVLDAPKVTNYCATKRIGISKAKEKLWRFVLEE